MSRRLAVWLAIVIVFVALVAGSAAGRGSDPAAVAGSLNRDGVEYTGTVVQEGDGDRRVAMVPIYNVLVDGDTPPGGGSTGGDDIVRMLDAIAEDEDAWDGVILELDTPGGSVLASEEITAALRRLLRETDLEVLAWMRGTAASAGFYVAAPTDRIVAAPSTFTGSIGVILELYVARELADKVGVKAVTIKSGRFKDIGNPLRNVTPAERAIFQEIIDEAYDEFVEVVARGRDLDEARVRELADGRIYTGRQAQKLGLVDKLGLRETAYSELAELIDRKGLEGDELEVVRFTRSFSLVESLTASTRAGLDGLAAAEAVGTVLRGERPKVQADAHGERRGNGFAKLEYRAQVG